MLKFLAGGFAIAGLVAAAGPILIHLLNRRRFRVVEWAAMNFLRQALQRNRRVLQLRDLIILVLRCLVVAMFGLALARPFVTGVSLPVVAGMVATVVALITAVSAAAAGILTGQARARRLAFSVCGAAGFISLLGVGLLVLQGRDSTATLLSGRQPVHAVVIIDNSLSMSYEALDGTLLDRAKAKAGEFIDLLPSGSQIHVIPLCAADSAAGSTALRSKSDARAALDRLTVADRIGKASQGLELAANACNQVPELANKRVVFISDQQSSLWDGSSAAKQLSELNDVQLMRIPIDTPQNVWVADFRLQDGVADTETPAVFIGRVQHSGEAPLANVRVALTVDDEEVASRLVDLEPGQVREVEFKHRFESLSNAGVSEAAGTATFVRATLSVAVEGGIGDRLTRDNARHLVAPVVAGLPVVFVDQYGADENIERNEVGETYRLRRLLAPRSSTDEEQGRQLIRIRHLTIDRLGKEQLADARLVVIAGVPSPGDSVALLRQYVQQGGSILIAAGAEFEPQAWSSAAWLEGAGLLPTPLNPEPTGQLPEVAVQQLETFSLDFKTLQHDFFLIEGEAAEALEDLYRAPIFFKAVVADTSERTIDALVTAETQRITQDREYLQESDERRRAWEALERQGSLSEADLSERTADEDRRAEVRPAWLKWATEELQLKLDELPAEQLALQTRPRVLARYTSNGHPFLVERRIGAGRVLLVTSGLYSSWNTFTSTPAILVFDRILRQLLEQTLPRRTFETGDVVTLPAQKSERTRWQVLGPDDRSEPLTVEALSANRYGVLVRRSLWQGHYSVTATDLGESDGSTTTPAVPLAFNCPAEESELSTLDALSFRQRIGDGTYRWLEEDDVLSLEGSQIRGRDLWKSLIFAVFLLLLAEMLILAWPHRRPEPAPQPV